MKKLLFMVAAILVFASAPKVLMAAPAVMAEQAALEEVEDYKIDWTTQSGYNNMWYPTETMNKDNFSVSTTDGLSVKNEKKLTIGRFNILQVIMFLLIRALIMLSRLP